MGLSHACLYGVDSTCAIPVCVHTCTSIVDSTMHASQVLHRMYGAACIPSTAAADEPERKRGLAAQRRAPQAAPIKRHDRAGDAAALADAGCQGQKLAGLVHGVAADLAVEAGRGFPLVIGVLRYLSCSGACMCTSTLAAAAGKTLMVQRTGLLKHGASIIALSILPS